MGGAAVVRAPVTVWSPPRVTRGGVGVDSWVGPSGPDVGESVARSAPTMSGESVSNAAPRFVAGDAVRDPGSLCTPLVAPFSSLF